MKNKNDIPVLRSILTGSFAAIIEAFVNHPLWAIKLRQQAGRAFTLNPFILYRGLILQMSSRIPTTSLQMLGSNYFKDHILSNVESQSTRSILSGFAGGVVAASLQTPVELTMNYQQKFGKNVFYQVNNIIKTRGVKALSTGYAGTAIRLGSYTCSFFSAQPLLKNKIQQKYAMPDMAAHAVSSVITGVLSTVISNPFDAVKTIQQDQLSDQKLNPVAAAKFLFQRDGYMGFFKGVTSRSLRVISGIAIISEINSYMNS